MPFFSIVIPTYNRAHLIQHALNAILKQDFADYEVIVVDDGSTDNTKTIVTGYSDSRINYIHQENGERGKARNTGTKNAKGTYIFFLDSDDLIAPTYLSVAAKHLTELNQPEFFHIRYQEIFPDGTICPTRTLNKDTIQQTINRQNQFACQFFLRKDVALQFPFCENRALKIGEDWDIILKVAQRYPLHFTNEVLGSIVHHGNRSMEVASSSVVLTSKNVLLERLGADTQIPKAVLKNVSVEFTFLAALSAAIERKRALAIGLWWKAFLQRPGIIFKRRTFAILKRIIGG